VIVSVKKGIILAGGSGSRLYPMTQIACKQLLPVYDKPMIYYPLSTLMLFGTTDILIISTSSDLPRIRELLGDGRQLGISLSYEIQERPNGIAEAITIGARFVAGQSFALILGDNIFYGNYDFLREARSFSGGAMVFAYVVREPHRYGVITFGAKGQPVSIIEKPEKPASHYAVTGFYLYDSQAVQIARSLKPSARGELEISDVNRAYLDRGQLKAVKLGRGIAWLDTGTPADMLEAGEFIATVERRQGQKIACIEEVAYRMEYISHSQLKMLADRLPQCDYRRYLYGVIEDGELRG
jgi:glucose-1-phosphate thymidylyltransferase